MTDFPVYKPLNYDKQADRDYLIDALIEESTDDRRRAYLEDLRQWTDEVFTQMEDFETTLDDRNEEIEELEEEKTELELTVMQLEKKLESK